MSLKRIAVTYSTPERYTEATQLAKQLQLPLLDDEFGATHYDYLLIFTPAYLGLQRIQDTPSLPFYIDFLAGKMRYRSQQAEPNNELLAKAIGLKAKQEALIVDATAGVGKDSFILASLGYSVIMLERSAILYALLQDALCRARLDARTASRIHKLQLIHTDALTWLQTAALTQRPEVIYLDPMFPTRKKSAAVKKDMTLLQDLIGEDKDADALFKLALTCATKRVVVKRPRLAAAIANATPSYTLTGKSSRFDVYLTPKPGPVKSD